MLDTPFYIACLKLTGRRCVVVGGGDIGLEKVEGLLACDGDVTLIAPDAIEPLQQLAREGSIRWEQREYAARRPRGRVHGDRGHRRHRREHPRVRGRRASRDARERGGRAAALQLHPAGDLPHRPARDRDLHGRREPCARQADQARDRRGVRRALRAPGRAAERGARLGQGHAAHLPGPQGVLRVDRERRSRPGGAAAPGRRAGRARPDRRGASSTRQPPAHRPTLITPRRRRAAPAWWTSAARR